MDCIIGELLEYFFFGQKPSVLFCNDAYWISYSVFIICKTLPVFVLKLLRMLPYYVCLSCVGEGCWARTFATFDFTFTSRCSWSLGYYKETYLSLFSFLLISTSVSFAGLDGVGVWLGLFFYYYFVALIFFFFLIF